MCIRDRNALCNIVTIFLATGTGLTMSGDKFLRLETIEIICLGLIAFAAGTAGGVLFGQIMRIASGNKINPLIGSAGVSAVPMAARVSQVVGLKDNPSNYLLMQATVSYTHLDVYKRQASTYRKHLLSESSAVLTALSLIHILV